MLIHLASVATIGCVLWLLRRPGGPSHKLRCLDGFGLYAAIATCLAIYALEYRRGPHMIVGLLALLLVARAVVVPSTARTTLLLSLPAAIGLLAIHLAHGTAYVSEVEVPASWTQGLMVFGQSVVLFGVVVATVASRVNFSLRSRLQEAERLGQYRLEEKIGEGGMGEVYRATHAGLCRPTAIKLLRPEVTGAETIERFRREVRIASRLTSPHVVAIYDYGHTGDGLFFYAMEYLDGADLREVVKETGPLPPARLVHLLIQVTRALSEAHEQGLVHRDLKSGNIMVTRRGDEADVAKVVDFGLVRQVVGAEASLTQVGAIVGTPETLAPEVIQGEPAGPAADLYALGIVAHRSLTGRETFEEAKTTLDLVRHHVDTTPRPPSAVSPDVPADLDEIVLRCLRKDPAERFEDAAALRRALEACSVAGLWTAEMADAWWHEFRPERPAVLCDVCD
jgi:serine/threonine-protein kinase